MKQNPQFVAEDNAMGFLSDDGGDNYNLCHCALLPLLHLLSAYSITVWSNFEIADMRFWRGEAYTAFTKFLDETGGFYYEVRRLSFPRSEPS